MTFTYDPEVLTTTLSQVRLTIQDTDSASPVFTDEELDYWIGETATVRLASAMALEAVASSKSRLAKMQKTLNWTMDDRAAAESLRKQAAALREDADANVAARGVIEKGHTPYNSWDIQRKEEQRSGLG